ncbi:MAG TPA: hypothetical protein VD996_05775 [Chitinophagaceae bacterium]|nr:hypothetical protein [Chitinophagaceae bacterium]
MATRKNYKTGIQKKCLRKAVFKNYENPEHTLFPEKLKLANELIVKTTFIKRQG